MVPLLATLALLAQSHGRTALHEAAAACQLDTVRRLVAGGADRLARDDDGATPALLARHCRENDPELASRLMELLFPPAAPESQVLSIHYAAAHRQTSVVEMFLKLGVSVDTPGPEGNRPLDIACLNGDLATTTLLLDHGANPNLLNKAGATPLHDAALNGNPEVIAALLKHGAEIDAVDTDTQSTPLHYAASMDRLDAVKTLVAHRANRQLKNSEGLNARQIAARNSFADVADFLAIP